MTKINCQRSLHQIEKVIQLKPNVLGNSDMFPFSRKNGKLWQFEMVYREMFNNIWTPTVEVM